MGDHHIEVGRFATNDRAEADDPIETRAVRDPARDRGDLERPRTAVDLDVAFRGAGAVEGVARPRDQLFDDEVVEP